MWWQELHQAALCHGPDESAGGTVVVALTLSLSMSPCMFPMFPSMSVFCHVPHGPVYVHVTPWPYTCHCPPHVPMHALVQRLYFYASFRALKGMNRNLFVSRQKNPRTIHISLLAEHPCAWQVGRTFFGGVSTQLSRKLRVLPQSLPIWLWKMPMGQRELKRWIYVGEDLQGYPVLLRPPE